MRQLGQARDRPAASRPATALRRRPLLAIVGGLALLVVALAPRAAVPPAGQTPARLRLPRRRILQVAGGGLAASLSTRADAAPLASSWSSPQPTDFTSPEVANRMAETDRDFGYIPLMLKALKQRIAKDKKLTILEIGTGANAVLAIQAAKLGAKKVYAVEVNDASAKSAEQVVDDNEEVPEGVVEVISGLSTNITLPEKVDMVIVSLFGGIATEDNALLAIKDAQQRHLKDPSDPKSYLPSGVQTFGAPCNFALHTTLVAPPRYEELEGQPIRFGAADSVLYPLCDPQIVESYMFNDKNLPGAGAVVKGKTLKFPVQGARIERSQNGYYRTLMVEKVPVEEAEDLSQAIAPTFSGMAFWPRLIMDPSGNDVIDSRGPSGAPARSHLDTLLSLMTPVPVLVSDGDIIKIDSSATFGKTVTSPVQYGFNAEIERAGSSR